MQGRFAECWWYLLISENGDGTQDGDHMEGRPVKPFMSSEVLLTWLFLLSVSYICSAVPQPPSSAMSLRWTELVSSFRILTASGEEMEQGWG